MAGLYIHIPFCKSKCPYCDFYSLTDMSLADTYTDSVIKRLGKYDEMSFDTLYIGGGTPSVIGANKLADIVNTVRSQLSDNAEITVECNPSSVDEDLLKRLSYVGVNRISLGLQSAVDGERRALGRLSGREKAALAVSWARAAGIDNISLDLMLGVPRQSMDSLRESIDFCLDIGVPHVSAYMLKLEQGTHFYDTRSSLPLPDEDTVCDMYLETVQRLSNCGLAQYEISNFAVSGFEGRHNLNYWDCGEYLGIGPAAHSFVDGKRFYFKRDISGFISGEPAVSDGDGGDFEEYAMLRLRLVEGLCNPQVSSRFGHNIPKSFFEKAQKYVLAGFAEADCNTIRLTPSGFLISNTIIADIIM